MRIRKCKVESKTGGIFDKALTRADCRYMGLGLVGHRGNEGGL